MSSLPLPLSISHQPCILFYVLLLLLLLFPTEWQSITIDSIIVLWIHRDRKGLATGSRHQRQPSWCKCIPLTWIHRIHRWNSALVDPLSVLDMLVVLVTNSFSHPHLLYVPPLPLSYMSLLPLSFPYLTPSPSLTNHASCPTYCCCSLQGGGRSPLHASALKGHTEVVQALLQAPGINVNQADVSIYLLTLSSVVVGG